MLVQEVLDEFRSKVFDLAPEYTWDEPTALRYLDQAQKEGAERSLILSEYANPDLTEITLVPSTNRYALHNKVLRIRPASPYTEDANGSRVPLKLLTEQQVLRIDQNWTNASTSGAICALVTDIEKGYLYTYPMPEVAALVKFGVYRLPMADITKTTDTLELPDEVHYDLIWWMLHLAYQKRDPDKADSELVDEYEKKFIRAFGPKLRWRHWRFFQSDYSDQVSTAWL